MQPTKNRILLVDDEADFRTLMRTKLESEGFDVISADSANTAMECLNAQRPDLILLDMLMPGQDGLDVYHSLREDHKTRTIPVIFLTAMAVEGHWEEMAYDTDGPCYVMGKPYDAGLIIRKVRELLASA